MPDSKLKIEYVSIGQLKSAEYNPRVIDAANVAKVKESIERHGMLGELICNQAQGRENVIIGGHLRLEALKQLGYTEAPVIYVSISDLAEEKDLNLRLNKAVGEWDLNLLAQFDESLLANVGFSSEELDDIFQIEDKPEEFDLQKELEKLDITKVTMQKGEIYQLGNSRLMIGDSTVEDDVLRLMDGQKASFCLTDPPYLLDYLNGKTKHGTAVTGFGAKRDRRYLETDVLPDNFTELWMTNIARIQSQDFSIIVFENPKNLRTIWNALEKHWKYRNTIVWHLPNRVQGFAAKFKFFNKSDIALVGTSGDISLNLESETDDLLQNEYENALFLTSSQPFFNNI